MDSPLVSVLLDQLQPLFIDPDFDSIFNKLTEGESNSARFLLKMELNRLWSPCIRILDMRSKGYPCQAIQHGSITHYLGEHDQKIFQETLQRYSQRYTIGVYEAVFASAKPNYNQAEDAKRTSQSNRLQLRTLTFGSYHQGREERIHFSSNILLLLENGQTVNAKTSNISINGLRIVLLDACEYEIGQPCQIIFSDLQQKEKNNDILQHPASYKIRGEDQQEQQKWLRLTCEDTRPAFREYLSQFIEQNKKHYKVSIDFAFTATEVKGFEQIYLPRLTGLPLFFSHQEQLKLEYILKTENNQIELEYWRNERNQDMLSGIFQPERMSRLIAQPSEIKTELIYCFTHTIRSHIYFFSATAQELEEKGLKALFFATGSKRPSWRVYQLTLQAADQKLELDKLIDSNITTEQYRLGLAHQLSQIKYIALLTAINLDSHLKDYQHWQPEQQDANLLRCFGHPSDAPPFQTERLHYVQLRREPRYIHKTPVTIKLGAHKLIGWTRDISTMGLQVELESVLHCKVGDVIFLSLPKMQNLTKAVDLSALSYRIVNCNNIKTILHLTVEGNPNAHPGHEFFQMLIEQNQKKLTIAKEPFHQHGMANSLRNLFVHYQFNYALYVDRHYASKLGTFGIGKTAHSLDPLFLNPDRQQADLHPLFRGDLLKKALLIPLHQARREDRPQTTELFILHRSSQNGKQTNDIRIGDDFYDTEEQKAFVNRAIAIGEFYSVQLCISRTGRPDMDYLAKELHYIAQYAIHKAKKLEEALWSVVGVCDIIDTTQATLQRLGIKQ